MSKKGADYRRRRREEKRAKRQAHNAETAEIYRQVLKRSGGRCEVRYPHELGMKERCDNRAAVMDHFRGRGHVAQSPENCWHLCNQHDRAKTAQHPNRTTWQLAFRLHSLKHGYAAEVEECDREIESERAIRAAAALMTPTVTPELLEAARQQAIARPVLPPDSPIPVPLPLLTQAEDELHHERRQGEDGDRDVGDG